MSETTRYLNTKETEVVKLIARGYTYKAIAKKLCVSLQTVHNTLSRTYEKLGIRNQQECILYVLGLVDPHLESLLKEVDELKEIPYSLELPKRVRNTKNGQFIPKKKSS